MAGTFIDELARLNQQNFLGGIAEGAQAIKEQKQNTALVDLYNQFRAKTTDLQTKDQQLADLNKMAISNGAYTGEVGSADKFGNIADAAAQAAANYSKLLQQSENYTNLYSPVISALATYGEDGVKLANTLTKELSLKKEQLEQQGKLPIQQMEFENALYQKAANKLQIESGQVKLNELKSDIATKDLLSSMLATDIGKQVFKFDTATGRSNYNPKDVYKQLSAVYGKDPSFGSAWLLLEDYIYNKMQKYDSASYLRATANKGGNESLDSAITTYSIMKSMTDKYGTLTNKPEYDWVRQAYVEAATAQKKDVTQIGSDAQVINSIEDAGAKKELQWLHEHFYDKSSDEYYWKYADILKGVTGRKELRHDDLLGLAGMPAFLDASKLITKDSGWHNPYETPVHYTQVAKQAERNMAEKKTSPLQQTKVSYVP